MKHSSYVNCVRRLMEQPGDSAVRRHTCGNNEICRVNRRIVPKLLINSIITLRSPQRDISHIHALLFPLSGRMQKYTRNMLQRISAEHCVTCAREASRTYLWHAATPSSTHRASGAITEWASRRDNARTLSARIYLDIVRSYAWEANSNAVIAKVVNYE